MADKSNARDNISDSVSSSNINNSSSNTSNDDLKSLESNPNKSKSIELHSDDSDLLSSWTFLGDSETSSMKDDENKVTIEPIIIQEINNYDKPSHVQETNSLITNEILTNIDNGNIR